jgi:ribosomal protein L11 methyltransferase
VSSKSHHRGQERLAQARRKRRASPAQVGQEPATKPAPTKTAALRQVSLQVPAEAEEPVVELFSRFFPVAPSVYHPHESRACVVTVYLDTQPLSRGWRRELAGQLKRLAEGGIPLGPGRLSNKPLPRENWAESWKRHFKPIRIGSALLIKPSWSPVRPRRNQAVLVLDPGLSFGTGHHPTTAFCLRQIVARLKRGHSCSFLDMGTGTGILAIAAAKLGFRPVEAFDFDPTALEVAQTNARTNQVREIIDFYHHDLTCPAGRRGKPFDVIAANIEYPILLQQVKRIINTLAPGGTLILAGILTSQFPQLESVYRRAGLQLLTARSEGEWRSGAFVKPD